MKWTDEDDRLCSQAQEEWQHQELVSALEYLTQGSPGVSGNDAYLRRLQEENPIIYDALLSAKWVGEENVGDKQYLILTEDGARDALKVAEHFSWMLHESR
jgi:hypothetical protein